MLCEVCKEESSATDSVTDVTDVMDVTDVRKKEEGRRKKEEGRGAGCQLNVKCSTSLLFDDDCPDPPIVGGNQSILFSFPS